MSRFARNLIAFALAIAIFGAGVFVGVVVDRHMLAVDPAGGVHLHAHLLEMFRRHLDLNDEQVRQIEEIMQRTRAEAEALLAERRPRMQELHARAQQEILAVLTEEQAAKYRSMLEHTEQLHGGHGAH